MLKKQKRRHLNVISIEEATERTVEKGSKFRAAIRPLAASSGGALIGANHFEVPPKCTAFPHHFHCAIEESIFILEGEGTMRIGEQRVAVKSGDYITFPPGPQYAHQLVNTGDKPIRYLCISSKSTTDVVGYPDSKKIGVSGSPSLNFFDKPWVRAIFREENQVDYYEGEESE